MRRTIVLLATLLAASLVSVQPSRAQFAECTDSYVDSFRLLAMGPGDFAWSPGQVDCHEFWSFSFNTPAGPRWIRLIGDADQTPRPEIRRAAERATQAMRALESYRIDNVTMMMAPSASTFTASHVGGVQGSRAPAWARRAEIKTQFNACHVTVILAGDYSEAEIYFTIGHELFHCVEMASVTTQQFNSYGPNSTWWLEGAAQGFGAITAGQPTPRLDRAAQFTAAVGERTPLYEMGYTAGVFFYWHIREKGIDALVPFLRQMASSGDAAAQMTAMAAALPLEDWRSFAQDYDDRRILHPTGAPLSFGERTEGETWFVEESTTYERELRRFVLETGWADYACGVWANEVNASSVQVRPESGGDWAAWPARFDTEGLIGVRLRIATMTSFANVDFELAADKREACRTCDVSRAIDSCIVGRWRQTGGGPLEYLRSRGVPITMAAQDPLVLTMRNDGTFSTNEIRTSVQMVQQMPRGNTMTGTGSGVTSPVHGRWSAEGGILQGCIDSGGRPDGTTVISSAGHSYATPWGGSVAGSSGGAEYTCSDSTFTTSSPTEHGPMTYTFTRETPPRR